MKFSRCLLVWLFLSAVHQLPAQTNIVSPGLTYSRQTLPGPFSIDVLQIDLTNPDIAIESYRPHGLIPLSRQVQNRMQSGDQVFAAVNGDFFSFKTLWPVGNQVVNGVFVTGVQSKRSHLGIVGRAKAFIMPLSFAGVCIVRGTSIPLSSVNQPRKTGEAVLYNSYWGSEAPFDSSGLKAVLYLVHSRWSVSDTIFTTVHSLVRLGRAEIPPDGAVLACDIPGSLEQRLAVGDTVKLLLGFSNSDLPFIQVIGGAGRILENGRLLNALDTLSEGLKPAFLNDRHPRTFVGLNSDTTVMFLCTVDGRQRSSIGMNFKEMGVFLKSLGAWNGMNFDGGGSTTMVVQGNVVNSPSDSTGERGIANSIQVVHLLKKDERKQ